MRVDFYATLRPIVGARSVDISLSEGATVARLVDEIATRWPLLSEHLFDEQGGLSRRVSIMVDGRNVRWLEGLETPIRPDHKIDIFPPVAGG